MASAQVGSLSGKLSFAKVAAMPAPNAQLTDPFFSEPRKARAVEQAGLRPTARNHNVTPATSAMPGNDALGPSHEERSQPEYITGAIDRLSLGENVPPSPRGPQSAGSGGSLEDDRSQLTTSSTKQQNFDTKSMASVTTFAMDEKESIRPDDSASVRAAEEDDTFNGSVSAKELRFHRDRVPSPTLSQGPIRANAPSVTIAARRYHTLTSTNAPRFGDLPATPISQDDAGRPSHPSLSASHPTDVGERSAILPLAPDEKLLDALAAPKDRLPLLQLEEKFMGFIKGSDSEFLDLPPQNSFARLLAHKLADYYSLAHSINEDGTSIRIFRTASATLPTPLHVLAKSIPVGPQPLPSATAVKIMRRAGLDPRQASAGGSTPGSSSVPSKTTSEAGLEATTEDGTPFLADGTANTYRDKSKLSREEREAQYKAARERIFGDVQESVTSESASTGENSATMSRSSSSSGKRKTRRNKTPKDDSFEARSAFIPSFAPMHLQGGPHQYHAQYSDQMYQAQRSGNVYGDGSMYGNGPTQPYPSFEPSLNYSNTMAYGPAGAQSFHSPDSWSTIQPAAGSFLQYPDLPHNYQANAQPMMPPMSSAYGQQAQTGAPHQDWATSQYQSPYQPPSGLGNPNMNGWGDYVPPAPVNNGSSPTYGHLSVVNYNNGPGPDFNAHRLASGGYSRSLFNPQTRSFVPNSTNTRGWGRGGRRKPSPPSGHGGASGFLSAFSADPSGAPIGTTPRMFDKGRNGAFPAPPPKEDSLKQKYGAPAHLPKKPPPPQGQLNFDESIGNRPVTANPTLITSASGTPASGMSA